MNSGDFQPGDTLLLVDGRNRQFLMVVPAPGKAVALRDEGVTSDTLCALHEGQLFTTPRLRRYLVMRPTLEELVMNMPRQAQVIYPKDLALMTAWGDIAPGQAVIEIGCGHGALTMYLLRALGPEGRLASFDLREDHLNRTRKNVARYLGEDTLARWTPVLGDPAQPEGLRGITCQRLFSDVPEPWTLLPAVAQALCPGGVWVAYLPTVLQMARLMETWHDSPEFCLAESFESWQRFWHVKPPSVRPEHFMKAHTGFILRARRRFRAEPGEEPLVPAADEDPAERAPESGPETD